MKSLTKFAELHKSLKKFLKKNMTFCCLFWCTGRRRLVFVVWSKTHNKNMSHFFKIFLQGFVKFSKVFHWFHVAKCYSEMKNEELSWKKLTSKYFGKLILWHSHLFFCENDFRIIVPRFPRLIEYFKKFFIGTCIFSKSQLIISAYYHM